MMTNIYPNSTSFRWQYLTHYSSVYNHSKYTTHLVLTVTGKVNRPWIINRTTGEELIIDYSIDNKKLHIDCKNHLIFVTDIEQETVFLNSSYPALFEEQLLINKGYPNELKETINEGNVLDHGRGDFITLKKGRNDLEFIGGDPDARVHYFWKHVFR